ncbi:unnamed protein product [Mytilus edulis]|uniref:Uncharacterized protein n=1 Tax=Mytilus edulis TaxID=6550 RepID=A0A8S3THS8_MYTED|nr:unnamed protein product [Mytilus edulis]
MSATAAAFLKFVLAMMEYWVVMKEMKTPKKGYHQLTREIKRDKLSNGLLEEILSAAERTFTLYPEFEEISSHMYQYICSETSMNMFKGDDNSQSGILSLEGAALTTARTMECLHMFKKLCCLLTKLGLGMAHRNAYVPYRNLENEPPVSMVEAKDKLKTVPEGICGFIDGHRMFTNDSGAVLCQKCGMSSRQNEFMMEMKKKMLISDSVHQVDTPADGKKEKIIGESVIDSDIVFKGIEAGKKYPFIVVQPNLHPIHQPDISFTLLDLDKVEDVVIELRTSVQKGTVLSYSFKTGQVKNPQDSKVQQVYKKDPLGKTVNFAMSSWPTTEKGDMFSKLTLTINGEAQIELKLPSKLYVPVLVYHGVKSADMKSVIMVHGHTQTNGQSTEVKPGMRLEALDRKTPNFWCVATVQTINPDDSFVIHFDGWTSGYDYVCTPDSTDIHPLGWLYATTHKLGTPSGKTIRLQEPKQYGKVFDWPIYCEEVGCLPVPYDFFSDEQKGETPSDETQRVYNHLGIAMVGSSKDTSNCSVENIPGYFIENQMMQLRDQSSDELISFYSNHRQFLCLLPEKFDLKNLRFLH